MAEVEYYSSKKLVVTSAMLTYGGHIYPISAIAGVEIRKLPESITDQHEASIGRGVVLCVLGALLVIACPFTAFGGNVGTAAALGLLGAILILVGWRIVSRSLAADRLASARREVHVQLASGDTVVVRTSSVSRAKEIRDAIGQALAKGTQTGTSTSMADELEKLAALRNAGVISESDWERAKDLYLGKRPDERVEAIAQLRKLHELHRDGVLSESEFNMKKWDILSRSSRSA